MRSTFRGFIVASIVAGGALFGSAALASQSYPGAIQEALDMPCPPTCSLCHLDNSGGPGNINSGFGAVARGEAGLGGGEVDRIPSVLETIEAFGDVDSNGNGILDIDELRVGDDPNQAGASYCDGVRYGCGARVAPGEQGPAGEGLAVAALALLALVIAGRKRRSGATTSSE